MYIQSVNCVVERLITRFVFVRFTFHYTYITI